MLLTSAVSIYTAIEFRRLAKHYEKFHDLKNRLESEAEVYEKYVKLVPQYFAKFVPNKETPSELLKFIDYTLKDYKQKTDSSTKK